MCYKLFLSGTVLLILFVGAIFKFLMLCTLP